MHAKAHQKIPYPHVSKPRNWLLVTMVDAPVALRKDEVLYWAKAPRWTHEPKICIAKLP